MIFILQMSFAHSLCLSLYNKYTTTGHVDNNPKSHTHTHTGAGECKRELGKVSTNLPSVDGLPERGAGSSVLLIRFASQRSRPLGSGPISGFSFDSDDMAPCPSPSSARWPSILSLHPTNRRDRRRRAGFITMVSTALRCPSRLIRFYLSLSQSLAHSASFRFHKDSW